LGSELLLLSALLWMIAAVVALGQWTILGRGLLVVGILSGIVGTVLQLPNPTPTALLPIRLAGEAITFRLEPEALWLMGFGLAPAGFACALASPSKVGMGGWLFGAALSLIGALGVFGLQNGAALLVAWETMSLGGAVLILSERLEASRGQTILFMLALLEVGSVALLLAIAILGLDASSLEISQFVARAAARTNAMQVGVGLLLLAGFGAKLGLLPFYEWFPGAYGSGSGASGAILSGVVLNAAFFGLARGLMEWLPAAPDDAFPLLSVVVIVVATISAILTILYAFQQDDWRRLLSFSSAENASIAVVALGAAMLFRSYQLQALAGLAWTVSLLHLAGHALAKGTLFLTADGIWRATGTYAITASGAGRSPLFGVGTLLAVPWRPALEQRLGQHVSGVMTASGVDWDFARKRGLGL
jgi:hydrogenase-4 component B